MSSDEITSLALPLSEEELSRARRLRLESDRAAFIARRGWLRHLLAGYLQASPADLAFQRGKFGKPFLCWPPGDCVDFNCAFSSALAVCAVTRDREVGVDIECIRQEYAFDGVVSRFFSEDERGLIGRAQGGERTRKFFEIWTRKEAYLKCRGVGLSGLEQPGEADLNGGGEGAGKHAVTDADSNVGGWTVSDFDAGGGYQAAVAIEGRDVEIPLSARPYSPLFDGARSLRPRS